MKGEIWPLLETNLYALKGDVLVVGACLPERYPEAFEAMAARADMVCSLCLESTHLNMAVTKLSAALGTGQVTGLRFASVDRSPHCTQMHYIRHEIERLTKDHAPLEDWVVNDEGAVRVPPEAVEWSKSLARLTELVRGAAAGE